MTVLSLRFCARAFSSCGKWGPLFIAVHGPLTIPASLVAEHRLQTRRLNNCGSRAQLLRGMWDLPRPGLEPVSPALAGRFSTTAPPGKPWGWVFNIRILGTQTFRHSPWCVEVLYTWVTVILSLGKASLPPQPHPYLPSWKPLLPWHCESGLVRGLCWTSTACSVLSEEQVDVAWEWLVVALMM